MKTIKNIKFIFITILLLLVVIAAIVLVTSFKTNSNELTKDVTDELSRTKFFIVDWYDEVSSVTDYVHVYNNQIQLGSYYLTYENLRMRAMYPRGAREFKLDYVTHAEFFTQNGYVYCILSYGKDGKYQFLINKE